jgi:hypothetical protein
VDWKTKRTIAAGIASLAIAGGAGAAYATTHSGAAAKTSRADQPFLVGVANRVHVDPNALLAAFKAEATARVDAAVAAGKLTPAMAAEIKTRIAGATLEHPFAGPGDRGPGGRGPGGEEHRGLRGLAEAAAGYIGITVDQLSTELQGGKSLAQVAQAHGKTVAGLEAGIVAAIKAKLDAAVAAGHLTSAQETAMLDGLKAHLDEIVNHTGPPGPPPGHFH